MAGKDDYSSFGHHYTDDVSRVLASGQHIHGRQAIFDFYKTVNHRLAARSRSTAW